MCSEYECRLPVRDLDIVRLALDSIVLNSHLVTKYDYESDISVVIILAQPKGLKNVHPRMNSRKARS